MRVLCESHPACAAHDAGPGHPERPDRLEAALTGIQDAFWADPRVLYVSMHQWPLYPGTGRLTETGEGPGAGLTVNLPLPPERSRWVPSEP